MSKRNLRYLSKTAAAFLCTTALLLNGSLVCASPSSETLEKKATDLQDEVNSLNSELATLGSKLEATSEEIKEKSAEIEKSKLDVSAAKINESNQYAAMKERIQFMYEGGNISLFEILLSSEDMSDFLNKAEYITMISDYDRNMLKELQDVRKNVEEKQDRLNQQQQELSALAKTLEIQQESLTARLSDASGNLSDYSEQLRLAKEAEAAAAEAQNSSESGSLDAKTESAKSSGSSASKAETDTKKEDSKPSEPSEDKNSSENTSPEEEDEPSDTTTVALLAAILECEAGGSYEGMLAVGTVITNRVASSRFPNNIRDVIYQKGQFSPVSSGKLDSVLKRGPSTSAYNAAKAILAGERHSKVKDCLYFNAAYTGKPGINLSLIHI